MTKFWIIEDWNLDRDPANDYDAKPLIQCKDCERMKEVTKGSGTLFYWCGIQRHHVEPSDFCSWGHPREIHDADE